MKVTISKRTTPDPLSCIGEMAGICWGSNTTDSHKNTKRAFDCIESGHGRVLEFPEIYMTIEGLSAKLAREFYTHIGGAPTRLQESTRYKDYSRSFRNIVPGSVAANEDAESIWMDAITEIHHGMVQLKDLGVPTEDYTNLLPLAYSTKVVAKMNLRTFSEMCSQRRCARAYWEYRELMSRIVQGLSQYSAEWHELLTQTDLALPKCKKLGYCPEARGCGSAISKAEALEILRKKDEEKKHERLEDASFLPF